MKELEEIAKDLSRLGFGDYKSKILATLFALGPSTAREISEASGVPRPKVYEILRGLAEEGTVEVQYGKPMIYIPIEAKRFLESLEKEYMETIVSLRKSFERIRKETSRKIYASTIVGEKGVLGKFKEVLLRSLQEVYIVIRDPKVLGKIREVLKVCKEKGVRIICVLDWRDKKTISALHSIDVEVYFTFKTKPNPSVNSILEILDQEKLIAAANVDGKGIYLIFSETEMIGVWIEIRVLAEIQKLMLKGFFGIR